jgi:hypothetical protein
MRLKRRPHATIEGAVRVSAALVIEAGGREHFLMIAGTKHRGVDSPRAGSYLSPMDTPDQIPDHVRNAFAARPFMDLTATQENSSAAAKATARFGTCQRL